jgi:hypothetical protein
MSYGDSNRWHEFRRLISTPDPPELGPGARSGRLPLDELTAALDRFFVDHSIPPPLAETLRSAALLWHDYLDESHSISQQIPGAHGSFLHGIMHRREPDYGNAKYWFRRAGDHPALPTIADRVLELLRQKREDAIANQLVPQNRWDPFAFVDACEKAAKKPPADPSVLTLRAIQAIEFEALAELVLTANA